MFFQGTKHFLFVMHVLNQRIQHLHRQLNITGHGWEVQISISLYVILGRGFRRGYTELDHLEGQQAALTLPQALSLSNGMVYKVFKVATLEEQELLILCVIHNLHHDNSVLEIEKWVILAVFIKIQAKHSIKSKLLFWQFLQTVILLGAINIFFIILVINDILGVEGLQILQFELTILFFEHVEHARFFRVLALSH